MKKVLLALLMIVGISLSSYAQYQRKMDGTPDMRFKENKEIYGSTYSTPRSTPSYSVPSFSYPSFSSPSLNLPRQSYPTKKDGTPDMRYKENRSMYGYSSKY